MRMRNDEVKVLASIIAWLLSGVIVGLVSSSSFFHFYFILFIWISSLAILAVFYYLLDEFEKRVR